MRPQNEESPSAGTPELSDITQNPTKGKEFMFMKVSQSDQFIKVKEYISRCDRLGFRYKINSFGQVCFQEGKDWSAFDGLRASLERPTSKFLKAVLASLGRMDRPYEQPKGLMQVIDPHSGLVIGELPGVAA